MRDFIIALAFANMIFVNVWLKFFYRSNFYTKYLPTANSYLALIINELLLAAVLWLGVKFLRRLNRSFIQQLIWRIIKIFVCLEVLTFIYVVTDANDIVKWILLVALIVLVIFKLMTKTALKILLISSPFVLIIFAQAIAGMVQDLSKPVLQQRAQTVFETNKAVPRIIWIVYDEMDQGVAFTNRPKNLKLPEFDRFRAEAFYTSNSYPPSNQTLSSFPAYIDGKLIANAEGKDLDKLAITYLGSKEPVFWGSQPNIFTEAKSMKINTALVGEFLPYSRLIGKDLTFCDWSLYSYDFGAPNNNVLSIMGAQAYGVFNVLGLRYIQHKRAYWKIFNCAKSLVADPNYGLVFIHMPIPHPPYIYKQPWWDSSEAKPGYDKNLILSDITLGNFRRLMENKGFWDNSTVIITSDHWLRQPYPGIKKDHRVPFMIKLAGQKESLQYEAPFNTVLCHDLALAIMHKEIISTIQLKIWFDNHKEKYSLQPLKMPWD